jgi:hypothetical protein
VRGRGDGTSGGSASRPGSPWPATPPSLVKALGPEPPGAPETIDFEVADAYLREPVA